MINKNDVSKIVGADISISEPMSSAMSLWSAMYDNAPAWVNSDIKSIGLAASISGEIARMTTAEMQVKLTGGVRADYMAEQLTHVVRTLKNQKLEYGLSRGGMVMKPYVYGNAIGVDFVGQDCFYPIDFDATGNMTSVVFSDTRKRGDWYYTRLEYHQMLDGGFYWIQNFVYRSHDKNTIGSRVNFTDIPVAEWRDTLPNTGEDGQPVQYIENVKKPLYGYFRFPSPNNIDPSSPLGVSCFSFAQTPNDGIQLIKQADQIYSNLVWEFESGKRRIYVDTTAFEKGSDGKPKLPDRALYRTLDRTTNISDKGNLFDEWSPEFREAAISSGLNDVLRRIEFAVRLAYGTLSDPQTVDKTATEVLSSQQRSYVTVTSTQEALRFALDDLLYAMSVWIDIYKLAPSGTYSATYEFDDSVISDKEAETLRLSQEVTQGITSKIEYRMQVKKEDEQTARKMLALVTEEQAQIADLFGETKI